jgi:hypothetical protein
VSARRVRIARERQPPDDPLSVLGHEDRGIGVALDGTEVAPLVGDGSPRAGAEDPAAFFAAHALGELDERVRVVGGGTPDARHATTIPTPPRLGSPAAWNAPSRVRSTA